MGAKTEIYKMINELPEEAKSEALQYLKAISKKHKSKKNESQEIQEGETIEIKGIKFPTFRLAGKLNNVNIRDFAYDDEDE